MTVAAVTLAVNLGSFAYLVLIARSASPAVFGALAALAGITLLFEVPANALQVAVGRALAATARRTGRPASRPGLCWYRPAFGGSRVCVVLLALSPLVERFLHLPSSPAPCYWPLTPLPVGVSVVPKASWSGRAASGSWPPA